MFYPYCRGYATTFFFDVLGIGGGIGFGLVFVHRGSSSFVLVIFLKIFCFLKIFVFERGPSMGRYCGHFFS